MIPTLLLSPSFDIKERYDIPVHMTELGDDYMQYSTKGLSPEIEWDVEAVGISDIEINNILTLLRNHGGVQGFFWKPNSSERLALFRADKWDTSLLSNNLWRFTATFKKYFEIADYTENTILLPATENLAAGDIVNVWNNSGSPAVRKASADAPNQGKTIDGYVLTATTAGSLAVVHLDSGNIISGLSGLTVGVTYYLGLNGSITATPTTVSGYTLQRVGKAVSTIELKFDPGRPVTLA